MKKLFTLLTMLILCVGSTWADVNAPTGYVSSIETGVNYLWCLNDGTHPRFIHADGTKTASNGHLTNAGIFQFEDAGDGYYYIKEVNTGNYMYTDYANSVTQRTGTTGKPWAYYDNNVLAAGAKEDADKFKWKVDASTGTTVSNGFFISSKVNANAVLAATSQGNTAVHFYQFTEAGTINYVTTDKYQFANSQFVKVATSLSDLSNNKCYNICNNLAWWAVGSGATEVNSTYTNSNGLNLAVSTTDTKQQFAFIKYIDNYYLYSVGEGKFAYKDGTKLSLADGFNNNVTSNGAVTFVTSTSKTYASSAPVVVTVANKNFGVSYNYSPTVYGYDDVSDNGNASAVCEAGSFTPTTALAKIESSFLFEPSTDLAPKYYAWLTAVGNNASYIHIDNSGNPVNPNNHNITTTGPIDSKYAWYFIGDPENGYAIKNKSTGTYLGGRTSSGGAMSMEASANCKFYPINEATATPTWNKWYDKVHNYYIDRSGGVPYAYTAGNKNNYIRLYNVKFSLSNAAAGLVVGSTTISDFTAYYLITSSASLSCAESGYTITAYDGYGTLTEALTNDDDGTINLTISLAPGITDLDDLSNSKKYKIVCYRGGLSTYTSGGNTYLASPIKTSLGVSAKDFAILKYGGRYYLYSVDDAKFVSYHSETEAKLQASPILINGTADAVTFTETSSGSGVYVIKFNNDATEILNSAGDNEYTYGIAINSYSTLDNGNQYVIVEAGDFDSETALGALKDYMEEMTTTYANTINALKAINWSDVGKKGQLNRYNFILGDFVLYAGNEMAYIEDLESQGYTTETLQYAQGLNIKNEGYALNLPATGKFYRIKGYSNNYITSNTAGSNASMNGTASANNIVYYSEDSQLIFFGSGYGLYNTSIVAPAGSTLNTYTFSEGAQSSHYYIKSDASGMGTYCYDNTSDGTKLDQNTNPVTSGSYQTDWTLEEVTVLPLSTNTDGYTTFSSPVPVTIPDECNAYIATTKDGSVIKMTEVTGNVAAETGLIISTDGSSQDLNFNIVESGTDYSDEEGDKNYLVANWKASNVSTTNNYFFGKYSGNYVFAKLTGETHPLAGHKAYLNGSSIPNASSARIAIIWGDDNDPTGISELNDESIALGDGKYYQNGKVVVVRNGIKYNVAGQIIK